MTVAYKATGCTLDQALDFFHCPLESDGLIWTAPPIGIGQLTHEWRRFCSVRKQQKTGAIEPTLQKRRRACERHRMSKRRRSPNEGVAFRALVEFGSANVQTPEHRLNSMLPLPTIRRRIRGLAPTHNLIAVKRRTESLPLLPEGCRRGPSGSLA